MAAILVNFDEILHSNLEVEKEDPFTPFLFCFNFTLIFIFIMLF